MKKLLCLLLLSSFLNSCASHSGRVCGGRGGARCVENSKSSSAQKNIT